MYLTSHDEQKKRAAELFESIMSKKILIEEPTLFSLEDGADAHRLLRKP